MKPRSIRDKNRRMRQAPPRTKEEADRLNSSRRRTPPKDKK